MKQITYNEPHFDPYTHKYDHSKMTTYTITAATQEEYDAIMAAITNPEREIPQDSIVITDAPPEPPAPEEQLRADVDYISIMTGVDLSV